MGQATNLIGVVFLTVGVIGDSILSLVAGGLLCTLGTLTFWAETKYAAVRAQAWRPPDLAREDATEKRKIV